VRLLRLHRMSTTETALFLADAEQTSAFGRWLAPSLVAGDVLLLDGPVGAGKSHLARAVIQARLADEGLTDDVPSPSFTLVQTYPTRIPMVHADLYRVGTSGDIAEIGLTDMLDDAITLIEWPAGALHLLPRDVLTLRLRTDVSGDGRTVHLSSPGQRWHEVLAGAASRWGQL
jgi:tRNA threonylcarbamoyl adenosine modification protein YjeE